MTKADIQLVRALADKRGRTEHGLFVAEGEKLIGELRGMQFMEENKEQAIKDLAAYSGQSEEYCEAVIFSNDSYTTPMIVEIDPYTDQVCEFYGILKATNDIDPNTPYQMEDHVNSTMYKYALDTLIARGENLDFYNRLVAVYDGK